MRAGFAIMARDFVKKFTSHPLPNSSDFPECQLIEKRRTMTAPAGGRGPVPPLAFAVLGSELGGATLAGVLCDWWLGTLPWLTIAGTFAGLLTAFVHMAKLVKPKPPESKP